MTTMEVPDVIDTGDRVGRVHGADQRVPPGAPVPNLSERPMRATVNDLLANGASYAMVVRALGEANEVLDKRDRVTIDSIRNHCTRHFPVQMVARATYREILERRAQESQVDFVEGVATAITPMAVLETVMVKGYETLVDDRTVVSYRDGMAAALKLHELLRQEAGEFDKAALIAEMGRVIEAVKEFVPKERWPELQARLQGEPPPPSARVRAGVGTADSGRPHQRRGWGDTDDDGVAGVAVVADCHSEVIERDEHLVRAESVAVDALRRG